MNRVANERPALLADSPILATDAEVEAAARAMARNEWSLSTEAEKDAWEEKHWRRYEATARLALSAAAKVRAIREDGEAIPHDVALAGFYEAQKADVKAKPLYDQCCSIYKAMRLTLNATQEGK